MTSDQITSVLTKIFEQDGHRIVLWNDADQEFGDFVASLTLPEVKIIRLDGESALQVKMRIELDEPTARFLIYSGREAPPMEHDWLLDIRHYAHTFRADRASILIDDLGLMNHSLRTHLLTRRRFFESKERLKKLQAIVEPTDLEADLDRKMIAVILRAEHPDLFSFLRVLFQGMTDEDSLDLSMPTSGWLQIEKMDLAEPFWAMVQATFGYTDEKPSLKNLLIRLLATDFCAGLRAEAPSSLVPLQLPETGRPNGAVCLSQWRDSNSTGSAYDILSEKIVALLRMDEIVTAYGIDELEGVRTFMTAEKRMMSLLRDRVMQEQDTIQATAIRQVATRRMDAHWASANLPSSHDCPRAAFRAVYLDLIHAAEFLELRRAHAEGFEGIESAKLWDSYRDTLYRFDQLYRHFCEQADIVETQTWSVLKPLRERIEQHYVTGFIAPLALAWGKHVESGFLANWRIPGVVSHQGFFQSKVKPILDEGPNRKVFVIISDAFRYEAARELLLDLNGKYRFKASLEPMLGVLPSYTALGMAALLPHSAVGYKPGGEVTVDSKPTAGLENRDTILGGYQGIALKADEVMAMKKDEGRERIRGKRVIYIYHNEIDAAGDSASTEADTFRAVRSAIQSLGQLTRQIVDKLNGSHVFITADHGFLFQESAPTLIDKTAMPSKPDGTVIAKKRYLLGRRLPNHPDVWHGKASETAGAEGDMEFWIPRGTSRFHFVGGARFIHGGAMLQEIMVPLITVNEIEGKSKTATQIGVHLIRHLLSDKIHVQLGILIILEVPADTA